MKTIEEAAKAHSERQPYGVWKDDAVKSFKAGAFFVQEWIPVKDDLPEIKPGAYQVLVKKGREVMSFWISDVIDRQNLADCYTHWRLIDYK